MWSGLLALLASQLHLRSPQLARTQLPTPPPAAYSTRFLLPLMQLPTPPLACTHTCRNLCYPHLGLARATCEQREKLWGGLEAMASDAVCGRP
eukprot:1156446-Pelagomonas_calceolata.AAC.4